MIKYFKIGYRVRDPQDAPEWRGVRTANVVASTEKKAVAQLLGMFNMFKTEIVGKPEEHEMTEEEYENG